MKIVVDADACPVKEEIVQVAARFETPVIMVASYAHVLPEQQGVTVVQVDRSLQAADLYISNRLCPKDVLVTDDYGLATIGLARKATSSPSVVTFFRSKESDSCWNVGMRCPGPGVEVCVSKVLVLSIIKTALDFYIL